MKEPINGGNFNQNLSTFDIKLDSCEFCFAAESENRLALERLWLPSELITDVLVVLL